MWDGSDIAQEGMFCLDPGTLISPMERSAFRTAPSKVLSWVLTSPAGCRNRAISPPREAFARVKANSVAASLNGSGYLFPFGREVVSGFSV
jgi:hypothetical protein